ncbi:MAG: SsrA-binding protein SmpB [Spirochaetes bacterium]|jgi:SsrA-binding protein|nr:SsrA-binding protein SmpB [Spirochaetota bacterium]
MQDKFTDIAVNKKARFEYEIVETIEAGIVLNGTEVKSLRLKKVNISDAYGKIMNGEAFIIGLNISPYEMANRFNHDPVRERKLLLHRREIKRLTGKLKEKGFTLVPLKMYFKNGRAKVLLGLGKGKAKYDKRRTIQKRDLDREMQRVWKRG